VVDNRNKANKAQNRRTTVRLFRGQAGQFDEEELHPSP
jgi:hypothetical protein